jgi:hypothetical protein
MGFFGMLAFLSLASFETRIISHLVIYLVNLMGMGAEQIRRTMDICVKVRVLGIGYLSYKTIGFLEN